MLEQRCPCAGHGCFGRHGVSVSFPQQNTTTGGRTPVRLLLFSYRYVYYRRLEVSVYYHFVRSTGQSVSSLPGCLFALWVAQRGGA